MLHGRYTSDVVLFTEEKNYIYFIADITDLGFTQPTDARDARYCPTTASLTCRGI